MGLPVRMVQYSAYESPEKAAGNCKHLNDMQQCL